MADYQILAHGDEHIAYHRQIGTDDDGNGVGVVFLGGFRSDMTGTKAMHLGAWCEARGCDYLRFDYFGHGASSGSFIDGTLSYWRDDVLAVLDNLTRGTQVLVGSSFGGFMAVLATMSRRERVAGLVLVAPAIDMTERLIRQTMSSVEQTQLMREGVIYRASEGEADPYPLTRALIEDGRQFCLLDTSDAVNTPSRPLIDIACPIRILHGQQDDAVPWTLSLEFIDAVRGDDIHLILLKGGDHRLSTPTELAILTERLGSLLDLAISER